MAENDSKIKKALEAAKKHSIYGGLDALINRGEKEPKKKTKKAPSSSYGIADKVEYVPSPSPRARRTKKEGFISPGIPSRQELNRREKEAAAARKERDSRLAEGDAPVVNVGPKQGGSKALPRKPKKATRASGY